MKKRKAYTIQNIEDKFSEKLIPGISFCPGKKLVPEHKGTATNSSYLSISHEFETRLSAISDRTSAQTMPTICLTSKSKYIINHSKQYSA